MNVTETLSEGLKRGFAVTVPTADIESKRAAKLGEISKQVRIAGFRPGKVPASIVKQRYGTAVMAEVLEAERAGRDAEAAGGAGPSPGRRSRRSK